MRWPWQQQEHPYTRDHFRYLLATTSLWELLLWYVLLNGIIAVTTGTVYFLLGGAEDMSVYDWSFYSLLQLFATEPPPDMSFTLNFWQKIVFIFNAAFGLFLPVILLGSIVFRIFVQRDIIIFSNYISITYRPFHRSYVMSIHAYNSSKLQILQPTSSIVLGQRYEKGFMNINVQEKVKAVMNYQMRNSFLIFLDKNDVEIIDAENKIYALKSINGHSVSPGSKIRINISGRIPVLGVDILEMYTYILPDDISWGGWELQRPDGFWQKFGETAYPFQPMPGHLEEATSPPARERPSVG